MRNEVNRAHKAKTTLRYLLILVGLVSVLSVSAQTLAQQPEVKMASTSVMVPCGSALPQAAVTGAVTTYSTNSAAKVPGRRRALDGDDDTPEKPDGPMQDPLGDAAWPLMLLAGAYALMRAILISKRKKQQKHCSVR